LSKNEPRVLIKLFFKKSVISKLILAGQWC